MRPALAITALTSLAACQPRDTMDGTVVLVIMDGVRPEESFGDETSSATGEPPSEMMPETWESLLPAGARNTETWNLGATSTTPAHAAMITGRRVPFANYPVHDEPGLYRTDLPTLFEVVRAQDDRDRAEVLIVTNTGLVQPLAHSDWPTYGAEFAASYTMVTLADGSDDPADKDGMVLDALQERMSNVQPRFAMLNLHKTDRSGHYGEYDDYPNAVRAIDEPLADFWKWVQSQQAYADDTWMLVVSDHGRHDAADTDPPWRHHGCDCLGCRRVPFLMLGPGVASGQDIDGPFLLNDVGPTLAALMDVELPWASGLVLDELFEEPTGMVSRSGLADLAMAGGMLAELRYTEDRSHRSELWIEGQRLSDPDAVVVEAPVLAAEDDLRWLCFRQLTLEPDEAETHWMPRCLLSEDAGGSWADIGAPDDTVGPFWRPDMLSTGDGGLILVYARNPYGLQFGGTDSGVSGTEVVAARYRRGAWDRSAVVEGQSFPMDASAVLDDDRVVLAVAAGRTGPLGRHTRDVFSASFSRRVNLGDWSAPQPMGLGELLAPGARWWRLEHPALRRSTDGNVQLAAVGYLDGSVLAVLSSSDDGGASWERSFTLDLEGDPMPHVQPVWLGDRAVFPVLPSDGADARLCAGGLDTEVTCIDAGTDLVMRLVADGDELWVLAHQGDGVWGLLDFDLSEFEG